MELIEKEEPYLSLNMIVKNEGHIIKDTLTKLLNKVPKLDYWVISDTGSTDETKKIILDFFKERNIKGELFDDEWKDFGHNRTKVLEHAFGKSKYLLVFDADDEICGDFVLPILTKDSYHLQFGDANGTSYTRTLIVNNKKKWKYVGVLHEIITCIESADTMEIIEGNYYTVSGKSGDRSRDVNKYLKDALILEKAYEEAVKNNDEIYNRYGFYCANSYFDSGKYKDAIKWYKITLNNKNWSQEKYVACKRLYDSYNALNQKETAIFYLIKAFSYDKERAECLCELVSYYCCNDMNDIAYGYYNIVKSFYNNRFLKEGLNDKLFLDVSKANLFLPYYMILVSDKVQDHDTTIQMYRIIFTKKHIERSKHYIGNMLYNLQFFIEKVKDDVNFIQLFREYIDFLISINYPIYDHEFMIKYEKYGIVLPKFSEPQFSLDECKKSNKILFYTGYSPFKWNYTYSINNALGGSETAITCLTKSFPENYEVYVAGDVTEEKVDNITYVHLDNLPNLIKSNAFHTIVVSRYLNFYELYKNFSAYQTFIWGHDVTLYAYGTDLSVESILTKWSSKIAGCVCQTEWHNNLFLSSFPQLKDKITIINNGIQIDKFIYKPIKITNRFIYTSCSERGLDRLLELWPNIIEKLPDAELFISSYNNFPKSEEDNKILEIINKTPSIKHMGKLNRSELYDLMASVEYWLYPTNFNETSCITSLELLASEVICIYYPIAGLVNTIGDYGIPIQREEEISTILSLSINDKIKIRRKGKEYALNCSWKNRAKQWCSMFFSNDSPLVETPLEKNNIKIINLKRREDRKKCMIKQLENENISNNNYEFIEAVDGIELTLTAELFSLFEKNDFNYKKGVIGCALSHIYLWNELINDEKSDFYVILEDDIKFCNNFKQHLDYVCKLFVEQKLEHLALGEYLSNKAFPIEDTKIETYKKDLYKEWNSFFAYIISKSAAVKSINYINNCSIKSAIDNPQAFGYILNYNTLNVKLIDCEIVNEHGSDIQTNTIDNYFNFTPFIKSKEELTVSFCDWWNTEYCGGVFDVNNNFFTNLLKEYNNYIIKLVSPNENPDILFYSIFGNSHEYYSASRKIFFSGEPYGQRDNADFNITFDTNSNKNTRIPLWLCYFSNSLLDECLKRQNNKNIVPYREKFCSFIATGPGLQNNRQEFIEKLSKYKQVDCGGSYLNNIGYNVPLGINCSGKIEHNNNYKFAMAFESTSYPGYVTEKICDIFKSNCIPIYWGHSDVVKDFNPTTFINANDFTNFDELVNYIIKVDNNDKLYESFFKEPMLSPEWLDILSDANKCFYKNLADCIIGKNNNLLVNVKKNYKKNSKKISQIFNIWHNKLFDKCYEKLDNYSLNKITMYDVNQKYQKVYNKEKNYKIIKEYELDYYNSLYQETNYCQTSCLYHVFKNKLYANNLFHNEDYIGFIQYDMELASDFIYDIEQKINQTPNDIFFYSLVVTNKIDVSYICNPYVNSILERYNNYFNTNHTYENIKAHNKSVFFICLHTFVIPTKTFIKMMTWYCTITDWLHSNYINGIYSESMSEVTEEIFGLFLLLQIIEDNNIQLDTLKLHHEWPNLHNETEWINYKVRMPEIIQTNVKLNTEEENVKLNIVEIDENNDLWIMYAFNGHNYKVLEDYITSLKQTYNILYTQDIDYVLSCNPKKISYIMYIYDDRIINKYKNTGVELSFLNTEPLSISYNVELLKQYINKYPYLKIYDYSPSNLQIIFNNNMYAELLEYQFYENENSLLKLLNENQTKIYDFGIITYGNTETNTIESLFYKKKDVVNELMKKGFKIHIISGWGIERDNELAKCKVILNIHSILGINGQMYYSKTFENIRCNRLLDAGFKILSEDSIHCNELINKHKDRDNLKFINYNDFKNIEYSEDFWNTIENNKHIIKKYCFIHSCSMENVGTYRLDYLVDKLKNTNCVDIFDKIYILNIGLPIKNIYGEKYEVINYSNNILLFENPTINFMQDFSQNNPNSYILYIHTKGVRYNPNDNKENDWIDYMLYFLVEKHKLCISILDNNYDTVGCNYWYDVNTNHIPPHYSGNFWWANTNYLRSLPSLSMEQPERMAPEFWLFKNKPVFYNLHSSYINHYAVSFPANKYVLNKL